MVYGCLHDRAPRYLADHLIPASDAAPRRLRLRSANLNRLAADLARPGTLTLSPERQSARMSKITNDGLTRYDCRAYYHAGPTVWKSLPDELKNSVTVLIALNDS